ncbi:methyl-accepting chemotaxis sensory transducer [Desulfofarcimen acetoxidans DSM 771]|uniref:Methyl-accepting chemotaxis sensory transducer n=1 Tax=Desulfofarcimen acetoxidans (strain ATCC 49208 / DSM 771 / KCTC 5769 / VKM B-1644 / 5575) TaxID=485916 RepID=C8W5J8_DESAS|nr:HAMP domain-containing methyl-accepting chemotaxis protein [Desulfofarcimen acetoxidans]ACV63998.1 methyl-accepting chemotaxis sensory transducer [Desulfofarcimen acetoxidans DSM 771]
MLNKILANIKITTKIYLSFGLALLILCSFAIISIAEFNKISNDAIGLQKNELPRYYNSMKLATMLNEQVMNIRAYMLYRDEKFASQFQDISKQSSVLEKEVYELSRQQKNKDILSAIMSHQDRYTAICTEQIIPLVRAGNIEGAVQAGNTVINDYQEIQRLLAEYTAGKDGDINKVVDDTLADSRQARNLILVLLVIASVLSVIIGYLLIISITKPIKEVIEEMYKMGEEHDLRERYLVEGVQDEIGSLRRTFNHMLVNRRRMITEIKDSSTTLAAQSEQLSASSEQVTSAVQEVVATINQLAMTTDSQSVNTSQVNQLALGMSEMAKQGSQAVENTLQKMNLINGKVVESTTVISDLDKRSHEIGQILEVITNIADQTNLLALNAAIEAARAGEAGRGFAVVAEEVRKLAEQSAGATKDIASIVKEIKGQTRLAVDSMDQVTGVVEDGVKVSAETSSILSKIIGEIERVTVMVGEISQAAENNSDMTQNLASASQETNANIEQVSASAQHLTEMAERLREMTAVYKL